jgi:hypothetical protein
VTEDEKARSLDAYERYCATMRGIGWPPDSHESWYAKHGIAPVEPVKDKGPEWGTWGDHAANHARAHQPRATRSLRSRVAMMLKAGMSKEEVAQLIGVPLEQMDQYADDAPRHDNGETHVADDHAALHEKRRRKLERAHAPQRSRAKA